MIKWKNEVKRIGMWLVEKYLLCMIAADLVLVAAAGIGYAEKTADLIKIEYSHEELSSYTENGSIGGKITEGQASGMYDIIPVMLLQKGYYKYTVQYEGNSAGSFCWPHTYVDFYDVMDQETVDLNGEKTIESRKFWLNADLDIALRLYYSGQGSVVFTGFCIEETNVSAKIELFWQIVLIAGINVLILLIVKEKRNPFPNSTKYVFFALFVTAMLASYPSLSGYIMDGHDIDFHLARIEGIAEGLLAGQFPVRISPTFYNGYGYATSIFYGELFLYFPALLRLIGFSVVDSYNAFLIAMNLFTVLICYYSFQKIFANKGIAVLTTLLYTCSPYRMMDIYTRAAIGEASAMMFLPLVVYGMYRIYTEDTEENSYKHAYIPLALGLTGIIQSHVITGEITGGMILLACTLLCVKTLQKRRLWTLLKTVGITLVINAWFLVPFVDFMLTQDIRVFATASADLIQNTGLYIPQLFAVFTDYALLALGSGSGVASEMTFSMGLALGLGLVLCLTMLLVKGEEQKQRKRQGICFLLLAVIAAWMATLYFPWDRISTSIPVAATLVASIQFTWCFVGAASVLAAVVTGYGLLLLCEKEGKNIGTVVIAALALVAVIQAMDYSQMMLFHMQPYSITENTFVTENNSGYASKGEYVLCDARYEVVTEIFEPRCFGDVQVTAYEKNGTSIVFSAESAGSEGYVLLPLLNYKGYAASSADGRITKHNLQMGENAVLKVNIPENYTGTISVWYQGFWYWRAAELLSLAGILYLAVAYRKEIQERKRVGEYDAQSKQR